MAATDWTNIVAGAIVTNNGEYVEQMVTGRLVADNTVVFRRPFRYNNGKTSLETVVRAFLDGVGTTAQVARVIVAPGTLLNLAPPAPPTPTQAEQDRAAYFVAKRKVRALKELQSLGLTDITQQMVDNAVTAWNALPFDSAWEDIG